MNETVTGLELTCREVIDFVMAYLDGELPARERAIFDAHLAICRDCRTYLASYRAALALHQQSHGGASPPAHLPEIPEDLVQAILAARQA